MKQQKLAAALAAALAFTLSATALAAQPDPNRVWVKYKPGAGAGAEAALKAAGARTHYRFDRLRAFAATVPPQALQGLRNNPNIEYIEADAPRYPSAQTTPWGITRVQAPETAATGADGTGIKVCVIDSGINANHEEFAGISMTGYPSGWNNDSCGHGTHVAGTIAAANNSVGVVGVSPAKVSLHIVKVFDGAACGWSYSSTLVDAANRCQAAGAKIISMSLGGSGSSATENTAFASLNSAGILSIAAAGNAGNSTFSYPASYASVMSVAATDSANAKASFSQYNSAVDIAAPGVGVLSTYPFKSADVTVGGNSYLVSAIDGTVQSTASGALVNGGLCDSVGSWAGKVVLCERGVISFAQKVANVTSGGGAAAVVYNNVSGGFSGTLNGSSTIPAVSMSQEDGQTLVASALGQNASVSTVPVSNTSGYAYLDGTSMATPHVSGVAALVWSAKPTATNADVRSAMESTALDLGAAGRDNNFGYGLVQAFDATEALLGGGGGGGTPPAGLTASKGAVVKNKSTITLNWTGGASTVDVRRNGSVVAGGIANTGTYAQSVRARGSYTYQVCNAGTSECSGSVTVSF
ncbi:hypothetical protein N800_09775 [Lysobacter daejeonensis GH1-9]|uniref:Peptidase S8/S53 domain-containing protein n=1 Tax=Lysobacter daejeonensis GH1-9 TaxID=1385517 RepID=A0A0A0ERL0_9GAMM|nr:S8 family serine peptidase [Lysobacter daejeonensis]KGM53129.1 hypothetical protein N800_09775 [Lysobacter daejeonensis GH1-9]